MVAWLISLGFSGYLSFCEAGAAEPRLHTVGVVGSIIDECFPRRFYVERGMRWLQLVYWGAPCGQGEVIRVLRTIQRTALLVGIGIIVLLTIFPRNFGRGWQSTPNPHAGQARSELVHRTQTYPLRSWDMPSTIRVAYGYGMGTSSLGRQYVMRIMHAALNVGVKRLRQLGWQLGIVGLVLWIVLGFSIAISAWKVVRELQGTPWFPGICIWFSQFFSFSLCMCISPYEDFLMNSWLWLLLGILYVCGCS